MLIVWPTVVCAAIGLVCGLFYWFADGADWRHQIVGLLFLVAGVILFWYGVNRK